MFNLTNACILIILGFAGYYVSTLNMTTATDCKSFAGETPNIRFVDTESELVYDLKTPKRYLLAKKNQHMAQFSRFVVGRSTIGLTLGDYSYKLNMQTGYKTMGFSGKLCPVLKDIQIELHYDSKIFVASEYASNKCAFDVILGHELDHHQVNVTNKRKYADWLKTDLPAIIMQISEKIEPVPKNQLQATTQSIQNEIEKALSLYIGVMNAKMEEENQKLDTRQEYKRLNHEIKICYR